MTRTLVAAGVAVGLLAGAGTDLSACGDKSLSAGGIRIQRAIAARYPATVLIYAPATSGVPSAMQVLHFQETLQKVGHKFQEVASASELQASLASGRFNVVLADPADIPLVQQQLGNSSTRAAVVAVTPKLTKAEAAVTALLSRFVITAPSYAGEYLVTIADAVRLRGKARRKA
jgi:hypothetical protein